MLISKNKKMIAKSIALMLAFVLTFSFVLTACKDKDARADVTNLETNLGTIGDKVTALEEANKSNVTTTALAETLAKYLQTAKFDENIAAILAEYEKTADAHEFVNDLLKDYVKSEDLNKVLSGYYTKEEIDAVKAGIEAAMADALAGYYTKAEVDAIKAELSGALTDALKGYYTKAEVDAIKDAIVATFANYYDKAAVDAVKAELNGLIADRYTKAEIDTIKNNIIAKFDDYYTIEGVDEAIDDAIALALANYYTKDATDAAITAAIAEALKNYSTTTDVNALIEAALANYWTIDQIKAELTKYALKAEVETILEGYYTKAETDDLLAGYLETSEGMAQVLALVEEYVDEFYAGKVDAWNKATAKVVETLANLSKVLNVTNDSIYTAKTWGEYTAELKKVFGVEYDAFTAAATAPNGQLWIEVMRSLSVNDFAKIDTFVTFAEDLETADDVIAEINKMIDDLTTAIGTEGIDTDDAKALAAIKAAIAEFDKDYGFNATPITVDLNTSAFCTGFAGTPLDAAGIAAKLKVNNTYTSNENYINDSGLKLSEYSTMQSAYDYLVAFANLINTKIDALTTKTGGFEAETLDASDIAEIALLVKLIETGNADVDGDSTVDYVNGFITENNGIRTPIEDNYTLYKFYKWLEFKVKFVDECAVAKANLDAYALEVSERFFNVDMNVANAEVVVDAKAAIDAIKYPDFNPEDDSDPTAIAQAALDEIVDAAELAMEDNYARAIIAQEQAAAIVAVDEYKTNNLTDAKYADIAKAADAYKAEIAAITPEVDPETGYVVAGGYKGALDAIKKAKTDALAALALAKDKVDYKEYIVDYATDLYNFEFSVAPSNADEIKAIVDKAAVDTFALIDAATNDTEVEAAKLAAEDAVDKAVYTNKLNNLISDTQTAVFAVITANTAVSDYGYATIFALRTIGTNFAAATSDDWATDYTAAAAQVELAKYKFDNKVLLLEGQKALNADAKYADYADEIAELVALGLTAIDNADSTAAVTTAKDTALAAAAKLYYTDLLIVDVKNAKDAIKALEANLADLDASLGLVDTAVEPFAALAIPTTTWEAEYNAAVVAINAAVAKVQNEAAKKPFMDQLAEKVQEADDAIVAAIGAGTYTEESTEVVDARAAITAAVKAFADLTAPTTTWEADYNTAVDAITAALIPNFLI